jgi:UDP-N-acetylmuramoyl-L-alanyl-D-glutamate--2,6-diaminopimelate ligase
MIRPFNTFSYSLQAAVELLAAETQNRSEITFTGISSKDKQVEPGDIFVAIPGEKVHGAGCS